MMTEHAWEMILREILSGMKPYLDIQTKILIDEFLYGTMREGKETMSSYVTKKINKHRDMCSALGFMKVKGKNCSHETEVQKDLPDEIKAYVYDKHRRSSGKNPSVGFVNTHCGPYYRDDPEVR